MSSIDDRIVRLEVQDSDFAKRLESDEKMLRKFSDTLGSVGTSGMADNIQTIADRFSTLGIVAVRALENITDKAVAAGEQLIKSLSVDNIASGWSKFEDETKAVGTLVSQGFKIEDVNRQIEELQWYTDETSYSFNDMLTAVSKFTAQGVSLQDSVSALEGIANWAAIAGQNAEAGSRAMRELSQVMGVGFVRYQDWSSIQTLMMDYDGLRDMILDTAVAMGTLKRNTDGTYESLRATTAQGMEAFTKEGLAGSLTTGKWFTSDVLTSVLKQFSEAVDPVYEYMQKNNVTASEAMEALRGTISDVAIGFFEAAQEARTLGDAIGSVKEGVSSTWQQTFKLIFGDYEQQKTLWTDLSERLYEVFVEGGNARNELLQTWSDLGGRKSLIQSFWNLLDAGIKLIDTLKVAWQAVFPSKSAEDLFNITKKFEEFTQKLIMGDATAIKIARTFQGVFYAIRLVKDILYAIIKPIASFLGSSDGLLDSILTITQAMGDWVTNFVHWIETNDKLQVVTQISTTVFSIFGKVVKTVGTVTLYIIGGIAKVISNLTIQSKGLGDSLKDAFGKPISKLKEFAKSIGTVKKDSSDLIEVQKSYAQTMQKFEDEGGGPVKTVSVIDKIINAFKKLGNAIKDTYSNYIKPFLKAISEFTGLGKIFQNGLIPGMYNLLATVASFATIFSMVKLIVSVVSGIADLIRGFTALSGIISGFAMNLKASAWLKFAAAMGIVVVAIKALLNLGWGKLLNGLSMLDEIGNRVVDTINKISFSSAAGLALLANTNIWPLVAGLTALAAVIWGLNEASQIFEVFGAAMSKAFSSDTYNNIMTFMQGIVGIFTVAAWGVLPLALSRMAEAIGKFVKSFKSLFGINNTVTFQVFKTDQSIPAKILKFALAIGVVTVSIYALGKAFKENQDGIIKGIITIGSIAGVLTLLGIALAGFSQLFSKGANYGTQILRATASFTIIAAAIVALGYIPVENLIRGGVVVASALSAILAFSAILSKISPIVGDLPEVIKRVGGAFISIAAASVILAVAIKMLAGQDWDSLWPGMVAIAGDLTVMAAALYAILQVIGTGTKGMGWTIASVGIAMIGMAAAVHLLSAAVISFSQAADLSKAGVALLELGGGLAFMAGALVLLSKATGGFLANVGSIVALIGMVGVIWLLGKALQQFTDPIMADGVTHMAAALVVLAGALGGLSAVVVALPELALGAAAVIAVLYGGVVIVDAFADALSKLADSVAKFVRVLKGDVWQTSLYTSSYALGEGTVKSYASGLSSSAGSRAMNGAIRHNVAEINDTITVEVQKSYANATNVAETEGEKSVNSIGNKIAEFLAPKSTAGTVVSEAAGLFSKSVVSDATDKASDKIVEFMPDLDEVISSALGSLTGEGSMSNWAAENLGSTWAALTMGSYASKTKAAMDAIDEYLAGRSKALTDSMLEAGLSVEETRNSRKALLSTDEKKAMKYLYSMDLDRMYDPLGTGVTQRSGILSTTKKLLDSSFSAHKAVMRNKDDFDELLTKLDEIFATVENTTITPTFDWSGVEAGYNDMLRDLTTNSGLTKLAATETATMTDYIRQYATMSKSFYNGIWHDMWTYNGPMSRVVEEGINGDVEWIYEGPMSGEYDKYTDTYYTELNGHIISIDEYAQQYNSYLQQLAEANDAQNNQLDVITENTDALNSSILDQTELSKYYNDNILDVMGTMNGKLDDLNLGISGLSKDMSNFNMYVDGDALVGSIATKMNGALGKLDKLTAQGVY